MRLSRSDALVIGDVVAAAARSEIMPRFFGIQSNAVREKLSSSGGCSDGALRKQMAPAVGG